MGDPIGDHFNPSDFDALQAEGGCQRHLGLPAARHQATRAVSSS